MTRISPRAFLEPFYQLSMCWSLAVENVGEQRLLGLSCGPVPLWAFHRTDKETRSGVLSMCESRGYRLIAV